MAIRKRNARGIALIQNFEKCVLRAYPDQGGIWTIGWGHTGPEVREGLLWTQQHADEVFDHDMFEKAETPIARLIEVPLTENQHGALCAFVFNVGGEALRNSTLRRLLNEAKYSAVPEQLARWNKVTVNGQRVVSQGLVNRREAEIQLWLTP